MGQVTNYEVKTIVALDAEAPPDHVSLQVHRDAREIAASQTEGDATRRVEFVPIFGVLPGKVLQALMDSTGEEERAAPSGTLGKC